MKEIMIKCNVGPMERRARFVLGAAAAIAAVFARGKAARAALGAVGLAGIATAASRYCPVYHAFGIRRCQPAYRAFPHLLRRL